MSTNREVKLWEENDWLRVLLSILVILLLSVAYFTIAKLQEIDSLWQGFLLNIIANLIPTFVLFVSAYFFFRRIDKLRSEKEIDDIAEKTAEKLIGTLLKSQQNFKEVNAKTSDSTKAASPLERKVRRELEISNKLFDDKSDPQKLIIQFTNRGNNIIHLKKVSYSQTGLGLPKDVLSKTYRLDKNGHDLLIPVSTNASELVPGSSYSVELCFEGKMTSEIINSWAGDWGYLHMELIYADEIVNPMYSI